MREAAETAIKMKRPKFKALPAMLRFPVLQKLMMVTFSPALVASATSVIGAQAGGNHVLEGWSLTLSSLIIIVVISFYTLEFRTLLRFRRVHHDACWQGADPPQAGDEVDDPILALLARAKLIKPRLRGFGGFEAPEVRPLLAWRLPQLCMHPCVIWLAEDVRT